MRFENLLICIEYFDMYLPYFLIDFELGKTKKGNEKSKSLSNFPLKMLSSPQYQSIDWYALLSPRYMSRYQCLIFDFYWWQHKLQNKKNICRYILIDN